MQTETIEAVVKHIVYAGDNGYHVLDVKPTAMQLNSGKKSSITVTGHFHRIGKGDSIQATGSWKSHKRFGPQFEAESCRVLPPVTDRGIISFLASGMVKGIREGIAKMLVSHFGMETLTIIREHPERMTEAPGIGPDRAAKIHKSVKEYHEVERIMVQLHSLGIQSSLAIRIYKHYQKQSQDSTAAASKAVEVIREQPYELTGIRGIGFTTADAIARKQGIGRTDPRRIRAGIVYTLEQASGNGHVCLPRDALIAEAGKILLNSTAGLHSELIEQAVSRLDLDTKIKSRALQGRLYHYLPSLYQAEETTASWLKAIAENATQLAKATEIEAITEAAETSLGVTFAAEQRSAIATAMEGGLVVITGGPGTGKTTITRAIVEACTANDKTVLLASPTGRAAKRLSEATGMEARTIHRLLEFDGRTRSFKRNQANPLEADAVLVDEASMLDITLTSKLLQAIDPETSLILVGDIDQLPSVGPGRVLQDVIDSGVARTVMLKEIFRQARGSLIVTNAHLINRGEMPITRNPNGAQPDFFFITEPDPEKLRETVCDLVARRLPAAYGHDPVSDIQVLTPMRKGPIGVHALNTALQEILNPSACRDLKSFGTCYRVGDKVMQITNNYDKEVFNGDIGIVAGIDHDEGELTVSYPGLGKVAYEESELGELVLAYATSIHKSQGSEYPVVVVPVHTQHYIMLQRNLVYTAVTRGKRLVILIGTAQALAMAVKNNKVPERHSNLVHLLREE